MERRLALLAGVAGHDLGQVQLILHHVQHECREMLLVHKVSHSGRQEQRIIDPPGAKCLAHAPQRIRLGHLRPVKIAIFSYALLACCTDFSDALLANRQTFDRSPCSGIDKLAPQRTRLSQRISLSRSSADLTCSAWVNCRAAYELFTR